MSGNPDSFYTTTDQSLKKIFSIFHGKISTRDPVGHATEIAFCVLALHQKSKEIIQEDQKILDSSHKVLLQKLLARSYHLIGFAHYLSLLHLSLLSANLAKMVSPLSSAANALNYNQSLMVDHFTQALRYLQDSLHCYWKSADRESTNVLSLNSIIKMTLVMADLCKVFKYAVNPLITTHPLSEQEQLYIFEITELTTHLLKGLLTHFSEIIPIDKRLEVSTLTRWVEKFFSTLALPLTATPMPSDLKADLKTFLTLMPKHPLFNPGSTNSAGTASTPKSTLSDTSSNSATFFVGEAVDSEEEAEDDDGTSLESEFQVPPPPTSESPDLVRSAQTLFLDFRGPTRPEPAQMRKFPQLIALSKPHAPRTPKAPTPKASTAFE